METVLAPLPPVEPASEKYPLLCCERPLHRQMSPKDVKLWM